MASAEESLTSPAERDPRVLRRFGRTRRLALAAAGIGIVPSLIILFFEAVNARGGYILAGWSFLLVGALTGLLALIFIGAFYNDIAGLVTTWLHRVH